jgi:hypothetical protein
MFRITAPDPRVSSFLGVEFSNGAATVEDLHPVRMQAFEQHGYTVTRLDAPDEIIAADLAGDLVELVAEPLEALTKAELRALAFEAGVTVPAKAKKADIIAALDAHTWPVLSEAVEGDTTEHTCDPVEG